MTEFYNVCSRDENPKTQKVSWLQYATLIKTDDGKMYLKNHDNPSKVDCCFKNEPREKTEQAPAPATQQVAPAPTEAPAEEEIDIQDIPF